MGWARRPPRLPAVKLIPVTGYLWPFGHQLMWPRLRCPVALLGPPNQFAACRSAARPRRALLARCSDPARSRQARGSFMARRWIIHGSTPTRRAPPLSRRALPAAAAGRSNCRRTHFRVLLSPDDLLFRLSVLSGSWLGTPPDASWAGKRSHLAPSIVLNECMLVPDAQIGRLRCMTTSCPGTQRRACLCASSNG